ncbi:MAG: response regulator transcription factor [Deinococcales bacterium]
MMSQKILIVEDDRDIAELIAINLRDDGYELKVVHDGLSALEEALEGGYDLMVLDVMLPKLDGFEVCKRLRAAQNYSLVLMLTAKSSELDRVLGLEIGADDYLTKPFSLRELQARVKALLRRKAQLETLVLQDSPKVIEAGQMRLEVDKRELYIAGRQVHLTTKEFDLLLQFARNPGRVYSRTQLLDLVWGYGFDGYEHTVNSHINRLRAKIEVDPAIPSYIQTVWGVGYKFRE